MEVPHGSWFLLSCHSHLLRIPGKKLITQDRNTTKTIIHTYFDRNLRNYNYEEVSYAADCRLYQPEQQDPLANIRYAFFDLFAFAHAAGWLIKTLVVRDPKIIFFQSVAFELIEYSLRDVLNNFK